MTLQTLGRPQMNTSPTVLRRSFEPAPIDPPQPETPIPTDAGKRRLLIVDDIRENREILRRRFERHGFLATEASGGVEALALIEREAFDQRCLANAGFSGQKHDRGHPI